MESLSLYIESLIFASDRAISIKTLKLTLNTHFENNFKDEEIVEAIEELKVKFSDPQHSFEPEFPTAGVACRNYSRFSDEYYRKMSNKGNKYRLPSKYMRCTYIDHT